MTDNTKQFLNNLGYEDINSYYQSLGHNSNNNNFIEVVSSLQNKNNNKPSIFIFYGDSSSGKTMFINYLKSVIGENNFINVINEEMDDPFDVLKTDNKIFILMDEMRLCLSFIPGVDSLNIGRAINKMMISKIEEGHKFIIQTYIDPTDDQCLTELIKEYPNKISILKFPNQF